MGASHGVRVICILAILLVQVGLNVDHVSGEMIITEPTWRQKSQYFDIDDKGDLLKIDYAKKTAKIIGSIDFSQTPDTYLIMGWVVNDGQYACIIIAEPSSYRGSVGRLYIYSAANDAIHKTDLLIDTNGDLAFLPVTATNCYLKFNDPKTKSEKHIVLDVKQNRIKGFFDFYIDQRSIYSISADGKKIYLANSLDSKIQQIDIKNDRIISVVDFRESIPTGESKGKERYFVRVLTSDLAMVARKNITQNRIKLILVDLARMSAIAETVEMPFFAGKFFIDDANDDQFVISCIEEIIEKGQCKPAGSIRQFISKHGEIKALKEIGFNPEKEVPLKQENYNFGIYPKYRFDYISKLKIRDRIREKIWRGFSEESVPEIKKLKNEIRQKLNKELFKSKEKLYKLQIH